MDIPEIFVNILSFSDIKAVKKCSITCRAFHNFVFTFIYSRTIEGIINKSSKRLQMCHHLKKDKYLYGLTIKSCFLQIGLFIVGTKVQHDNMMTTILILNIVDCKGNVYELRHQTNSFDDMFFFISDDHEFLKIKLKSQTKKQVLFMNLKTFKITDNSSDVKFHPINENCVRVFNDDTSIIPINHTKGNPLFFHKIKKGYELKGMRYYSFGGIEKYHSYQDKFHNNRLIFHYFHQVLYKNFEFCYVIEKTTQNNFNVVSYFSNQNLKNSKKFIVWCPYRRNYVKVNLSLESSMVKMFIK